MRRLDWPSQITFVDANGSSIRPVERDALLARFRAVEDDGPLLSFAVAFAVMWRSIPVLRPIELFARNLLMLSPSLPLTPFAQGPEPVLISAHSGGK